MSALPPPSVITQRGRRVASSTTPPPSTSTYPTTGRRTRSCTSDAARLDPPDRRPGLVFSAPPGTARALGAVGCGGRPQPPVPARGVRTRGIPLVFGAAAHSLVVAGPAHGLVSRGVQGFHN